MRRKNQPYVELSLGGELYSLWKQELIALEVEVLKELGFACYEEIDHPHFYVLEILTGLGIVEEASKASFCDPTFSMAQLILNILNDSMYFNIFLRYDALYIAAAATLLSMSAPDRELIWSCAVRRFRLDGELLKEIIAELQCISILPGSLSDCEDDYGVSILCESMQFVLPITVFLSGCCVGFATD
jgi:hypothetical protein